MCPFVAVTSPIFTREMLEKLPLKTVESDLDSSLSSPGFLSGRMRPNYCRLDLFKPEGPAAQVLKEILWTCPEAEVGDDFPRQVVFVGPIVIR